MRTPGTPGTGITGAKVKCSLGADNQLFPQAGPEIQCGFRPALYLDRAADAYPRDFLGSLAQLARISSKQCSVLAQFADRVLRRAGA
jgi:hypothetical protein